MDVIRFVRQPNRANDPTRRYRVVRGDEHEGAAEGLQEIATTHEGASRHSVTFSGRGTRS